MKQVFKKGDKVFDIQFGWGVVVEINDKYTFSVFVEFDSGCQTYTKNGYYDDDFKHPSLSFTEYTIQGFSQERPIDYTEYIGCWGIFWGDDDNAILNIGKLVRIDTGTNHPYYNCKSENYQFFQPLTDEQLKAMGLTNEKFK